MGIEQIEHAITVARVDSHQVATTLYCHFISSLPSSLSANLLVELTMQTCRTQ